MNPAPQHSSSGATAFRSVYIQTFGCQMNDYDTTKMLEILRREQYRAVDSPEAADLILINSCAIREKAENKVYSLLGRLEQIKRARPGLRIGVGGCVAQQEGKRILERSPLVDLVFGTDNLFELPDMLDEVARGQRVVRTEWHSRKVKVQNFIPPEAMGAPTTGVPGRGIAAHTPFPAMASPASLPSQSAAPFEIGAGPVGDGATGAVIGPKAQLAITKGCNNFCTFCVVPYTRGLEVSREPENIVAEARDLVERGAREITLLGQNVNSYRANGTDFVDLLYRMAELPGLERIRYISPHPKDFDERLARAHREIEVLCEHLHLPFQSGSDTILKAMRRNHTIATYLDKLAMVREMVPGIALSTDIIVGFPGESEADFEATLAVLETVRFDHLYGFKFSPRSITPAAGMPDQVDEAVKAERLEQVLALHESILGEVNGALIGSVQEVMVEGPHPREPRAAVGRNRGHKSTTILDCIAAPGDMIPVRINAVRKFSLVGTRTGHGEQ